MPARSQERRGGNTIHARRPLTMGTWTRRTQRRSLRPAPNPSKRTVSLPASKAATTFRPAAGCWVWKPISRRCSGGVPYPGSAPLGAKPPGGPVFTVFSSAQSDWLLTARPRLGFVAPNNWLFYATGGVAVTRLHSDIFFTDNVFALEAGKVDTTKLGYAVGGGIEAPLTNRLSIKADYLHVGFGNTAGASTANNLVPFFPAQVFTHSSDLKADMVRVGLNYHFDAADAPSGHASLLPNTTISARRPRARRFRRWPLSTRTALP